MSNSVSVPFLNEVMMFKNSVLKLVASQRLDLKFLENHVVVESGGELGKDTFTLVRLFGLTTKSQWNSHRLQKK